MPRLPLPGDNDPRCAECAHKLPCPYQEAHEKARTASQNRTRLGGRPRRGETREEMRARKGLRQK